MKITTRRLMTAIAILSIPLAFLAFIAREPRGIAPSTASEWAWYEVEYHDRKLLDEYSKAQLKLYRELAQEFERSGEKMDEATYKGPFSDILAVGQSAVTSRAVRAEKDTDGNAAEEREVWS